MDIAFSYYDGTREVPWGSTEELAFTKKPLGRGTEDPGACGCLGVRYPAGGLESWGGSWMERVFGHGEVLLNHGFFGLSRDGAVLSEQQS